MAEKRCTAVVLAAGSGKRMHSATAKQFMLLEGKPVLWYSLQAVERSGIIDDCIIVTGEGDIPYVQQEIVEKYGLCKVKAVIAGGKERYESVYNALCFMTDRQKDLSNQDGYVFIHDGARPFLTEDILAATYREVCRHRACVAAVPVKDTIKIADEDGFVACTPERSRMWAVQTPQVFELSLITDAYRMLFEKLGSGEKISVTDDAMVLENIFGVPVKLVEASYENIKITTPEDIGTAESFLHKRPEKQAKTQAGDDM